jgi:hypothetical protein
VPPTLQILVLGLALGACAKRPPPPAPAASTSAAPRIALGSLGTPTGFELVASATGATLVWAPSRRTDGALKKVELDGDGALRGAATAAVPGGAVAGDISDVAATWVDGRLALAWVERTGAAARVRATWAEAGGPPFELGAAWAAPGTARGNVVVAARDGQALVFARGSETACTDPTRHGCFGFDFHELEPGRAKKSGLPLSVPVPCASDSAQLVVVGTRFHYGLCTDTGERPITTMFTIERNPDYARADPLLEGCTPVGTFVWRGAAWLVADCDGGRRAVRLGARDEAAQFLDLHARRFDCHAGIASLRAPSLDLELEEPRSSLTALLPRELAPAGARAAWTGRALVVATPLGERVRLVRHRCQGERLEASTLELE